MIILGIHGTLNLIHEEKFGFSDTQFHDASASLLKDGKILAAFEEERLNRIKHTNKFPILSIKNCLHYAHISLNDVDHIVFDASEDVANTALEHYYIENEVDEKNRLSIRRYLQKIIYDEFFYTYPLNDFEFVNHHHAHAASSYFLSGMNESLIVTLDGFGEKYSGTVFFAQDNSLTSLSSYSMDQSLGYLYAFVTIDVLGFSSFSEYKVMGLAPYGDPQRYGFLFADNYQLLPDGNYSINRDKIVEELKKIVKAAGPSGQISQVHKDIAAGLQETLEIIVFHILRYFKQQTSASNMCFAGGVALNATLNGKIALSGLFNDVFIFPAANDSGISTGLALACYYKKMPNANKYTLPNAFLGSFYKANSKNDESSVQVWSDFVSFEKVGNITAKAAQLLAEDNVIGWVQGRSEFGPRALGNRSILADPRPAENKNRINKMIKKREGFRPFAPSVIEEYADEYFVLPTAMKSFPYMLHVFEVRPKYRDTLGAVTHVDGSARIQTVSSEHATYYELLQEFQKRTGIPMLLNTSFNNNVEPIVDNIDDAITSFLTTELNYLVIGDHLISKKEAAVQNIGRLHIRLHQSICIIAEMGDVGKKEYLYTSPEEVYFIVNSYNRKKMEIPFEISFVLSKADGTRTIDDIVHSLSLEAERAKIIEGILDLWNKRIVVLSPCKQKVNELSYKSEPMVAKRNTVMG